MNNIFSNVQRPIVEFAGITTFLVIYAYAEDFYISKAPILELLLLYGVCMLVFRVISFANPWFGYTAADLITPISFLVVLFLSIFLSYHFIPNYNFGPVKVSDEEMGKDCEDARWKVTIEYFEKGNFCDSYSFNIRGNTKYAQEQCEKKVNEWKGNYPQFKYRWHSINLYHLPKDYVRSHRYPVHMYETADLNGDLLKPGESNGMN